MYMLPPHLELGLSLRPGCPQRDGPQHDTRDRVVEALLRGGQGLQGRAGQHKQDKATLRLTGVT
jgi:hypothetical protein